jgi:transcriptional regulator with XRE-family HTH domain
VIKITITEKLKSMRAEHNLSMKACADGSGIPYNTYQKYEYGEREISVSALQKLADFYGVTTDYLLDREAAPDPFGDLNFSADSETEVIDKYMSLPPEIRACMLDVLVQLGDAAKNGTESKRCTYTVQVAARGGDQPHTVEITPEEKERIANLPRVPDDL